MPSKKEKCIIVKKAVVMVTSFSVLKNQKRKYRFHGNS